MPLSLSNFGRTASGSWPSVVTLFPFNVASLPSDEGRFRIAVATFLSLGAWTAIVSPPVLPSNGVSHLPSHMSR